jgi:hypothetical protein
MQSSSINLKIEKNNKKIVNKKKPVMAESLK